LRREMPELPEVEMVRRYVEERCVGRTITKVKILDEAILDRLLPSQFISSVRCRAVTGVSRHGKQLFIDLGSMLITVHLGMTGDLITLKGRKKLPKHARAVFALDDGARLVYDDPRKFGAIGIASSLADFAEERRLGPDALKVSKKEFVRSAQKTHRAIKTVLLDQHLVAGVGNLYADESLYQSRINPLRASDDLSEEELGRIWVEVRHVLNASIDVSTDFQELPGSFLLHSRVAGSPCHRCNGLLQSMRVGGRTTVFCPVCQASK
jgi:formamidopyrimidine-DNA glycosylase